MANIIFSDEIVKLTDLRKKQKQWFEKAYHKPIPVPYKDDNLTIMNRAEIGRVLEQMKYITLLIEHWNEIKHKKDSKEKIAIGKCIKIRCNDLYHILGSQMQQDYLTNGCWKLLPILWSCGIWRW